MTEQLRLLHTDGRPDTASVDIAAIFDPARMTQARRLAGLTKSALAAKIGITPAAVGQWEAGTTPPRRDHLQATADILDVPITFFAIGRPHARLDESAAHFRSLRSTRASQRAKAIAFVEQVWELAYALEKRVQLPPVDLPGFSDGEISRDDLPTDPQEAARELRRYWNLGHGPIAHLVRTMETRGLLVTLIPFAGADTPCVDAFSASRLSRPIVVLAPDRADDVYRHRFTAAHELGHLLLHSDTAPGDPLQEREANLFAAEFLTPRDAIREDLPSRLDFVALDQVSKAWGVSVKSLVFRSRELGLLSDATARRAYQRLKQMENLGLITGDPVTNYPGEVPCLLSKAYALAETKGLTLVTLANELKWKLPRLRLLLGDADPRPALRLV
ncbi:XRE family transcriptional regulator [Microbispora bryophytorum]|uniref:XRE family transcriptional regulator n=1 Tax=Microbispora bryophytorum TaxID=1460882 RepID=UPI00340621FE